MEPRTDLSLLNAIVHDRDHDAFTEFHQRYEKRAFNIGLRILRNATLAQDAVQETMLSIWRAPVFTLPKGDVEDWVLRIVMNKSINLGCSNKRSAKREARVAMEQNSSHIPAANEVEANEVVSILRNCIDELPDLERTVLVCSYCTKMSHREIAKVVGISQPFVSKKIQQALNSLRLSLTRVGVASALPLLSSEVLLEAMKSGKECPPGLTESLLAKIATPEAAAKSSIRGLPSRAVSGLPAAGLAAAVVVLGAATALYFSQTSPTAEKKPGRDLVSVPVQANIEEPPALNYHWIFTQPAPSEIVVRDGSWIWNSRTHQMDARGIAVLQLPGPRPRKPLRVALKTTFLGGGLASFGILSSDGRVILKRRSWAVAARAIKPGDKRNYQAYIVGSYAFEYFDNKLQDVAEFSEPDLQKNLILIMRNVGADDLSMKEVSDLELPPETRDPKALIARLGWPVITIGDEPLPAMNTLHR